ncbi:LTA synthase family protein [Flaviaesturariibacter terrae]
MPARLRFLLQYFLLWLLFFEAGRALFLLGQWGALRHTPGATALASFWYGARMDASMAAYLSLPLTVFLLLSFFVPFFRKPLIYQVYTIVVAVPALLLIVCDIEVYRQWGFRLDATPLKYLSAPAEAWASISHLPVVRYTLLFLLLCVLLGIGAVKLLRRLCTRLQRPERWYIGVPLLLLATALLIIPARGGLQQTPLNQSSVYFSSNNFANQAALNVPWNFLFGVLSETAAGSEVNPYNYMPAAEAQRVVDSLPQAGTLHLPVNLGNRPNVLVVIWESGTAKVIDKVFEGTTVTPGINQLKQEGLWFANAWASGDRTDKGLPAVLSGYPALPQSSVIRLPNKARKLQSLPALYKAAGYGTSFYYGGEPEFANIKSYLLAAGFDPLIEKSDFAAKDQNSKWGAHDGVVADRLFDEVTKTAAGGHPFFRTWLTLSSHEPFETPVPTVIAGNDDTHQFLNSLHYTDSVLYHFVRRCQAQPWWANTVLVIVADHGHPLPEGDRRINNFRIPILFLGGSIQPQTVLQNVSQLDIAATLAPPGTASTAFPFSHTLLRPSGRAFFSFNNGFGYVQDSSYILYDNVGRQLLEQSAGASPRMIRAGQALQQLTYQDYLDK